MNSQEEQRLLEKLASGSLDGRVGDEREYREYRSIYCGMLIKDGIPISYRQDAPSGSEKERLENTFETDETKLEFLRRYGWLMEDKDVKAYSARYKTRRRGCCSRAYSAEKEE